MADGLVDGFVAALDEAQRAEVSARGELAAELAAVIAEARAAWPAVRVDDGGFARYLAERMPAPVAGAPLFGAVRTGDLFLACGCRHGDTGAVAAFMETFRPDLEAVVRRFRALPADAADVVQSLWERLLVAAPGQAAPRIADYSGLGFLQNWVRIAAVRAFVDAGRRRDVRGEVDEPDALLAVADADDDVELAYLKRHARGEFRAAFTQAIASLSPRDRNALRQHVIAGLTIDQLAVLYGTHRATAARRVASARAALLEATRAILAERLGIDDEELGSVMRLIHSQLDVSLVRLLHASGQR